MRLDFFCKQISLTLIISDRKGVTIEGKKKKLCFSRNYNTHLWILESSSVSGLCGCVFYL